MLIEALVVTVYVSYIPSINIRSILKIKENLRALTKVERCGGNQVSVMNKSCSKSALQVSGSICFLNRGKLQAVEYTKCIIGCSEYNVLCLKNYVIKTTVNGCVNSNFNFLIKRNCHNSLCKRKFSRNYDFNGMLANNLATIYHLCCYRSKLAVRYEHAILDGTHRRICELPLNVSRNFCLSTYQVGSKSRELNCASGSIVCTLGRNCCTSKSSISRSGCDEENTCSSRTLCTVGRRVINLQLFTGSLRNPSCRTTTITVYCIRATKVKHYLSKLIHRHTLGIR